MAARAIAQVTARASARAARAAAPRAAAAGMGAAATGPAATARTASFAGVGVALAAVVYPLAVRRVPCAASTHTFYGIIACFATRAPTA